MRSKNRPTGQLNFLAPTLKEQLNPKNELYLLADAVDWDHFEKEFAPLYSDKGRPAHPIRLMASLLTLKAVYNLSDGMPVERHWEMNAYFQYFGGISVQQRGSPRAVGDLVHFRQRIGEQGVERIFKHSIDRHGRDGKDPNVSIDTTAQEKNIACPTDAKLHKKIIDKRAKTAKAHAIVPRRSYRRTSKQLARDTYNGTHPKRKKRADAAKRKLRTIAGRLVRELERNLPEGAGTGELEIFKRVFPNRKTARTGHTAFTSPRSIARARARHIKI